MIAHSVMNTFSVLAGRIVGAFVAVARIESGVQTVLQGGTVLRLPLIPTSNRNCKVVLRANRAGGILCGPWLMQKCAVGSVFRFGLMATKVLGYWHTFQ